MQAETHTCVFGVLTLYNFGGSHDPRHTKTLLSAIAIEYRIAVKKPSADKRGVAFADNISAFTHSQNFCAAEISSYINLHTNLHTQQAQHGKSLKSEPLIKRSTD